MAVVGVSVVRRKPRDPRRGPAAAGGRGLVPLSPRLPSPAAALWGVDSPWDVCTARVSGPRINLTTKTLGPSPLKRILPKLQESRKKMCYVVLRQGEAVCGLFEEKGFGNAEILVQAECRQLRRGHVAPLPLGLGRKGTG